MSADNGIYVVRTNGERTNKFEYRVKHLQAADNLDWDPKSKKYVEGYSTNRAENVRIVNVRGMFKDCKIFHTELDAINEAVKLYDEVGWTEYGICHLYINKKF